MVTTKLTRLAVWGLVLAVGLMMLTPIALAAAGAEEEGPVADPNTVGNAIRVVGITIAAALAIALAGMGTARVQTAVGASGAGALAEKPELFGRILVLFAIPETIVVLGFVVAVMILGTI